jgi:hypothetical protein
VSGASGGRRAAGGDWLQWLRRGCGAAAAGGGRRQVDEVFAHVDDNEDRDEAREREGERERE